MLASVSIQTWSGMALLNQERVTRRAENYRYVWKKLVPLVEHKFQIRIEHCDNDIGIVVLIFSPKQR